MLKSDFRLSETGTFLNVAPVIKICGSSQNRMLTAQHLVRNVSQNLRCICHLTSVQDHPPSIG